MSSKTVEWGTPRPLFDALNARYQFTVDAAATSENALLPRYFTKEVDGLAQDWDNERVWCNPPYGRGIDAWCKKAALSRNLVVMLLPARTDTAYWHEWIIPNVVDVFFVRGRLCFAPSKTPAPFPSALAVFAPDEDLSCEMSSISRAGEVLV